MHAWTKIAIFQWIVEDISSHEIIEGFFDHNNAIVLLFEIWEKSRWWW